MRFAAVLLLGQMLSAAPYLMYVGTYTKKESKGIYAYRFDPKTGTATALGLVAETPSPSWLTLSPDRKVLFVANELGDYQGLKSGAISSWQIDHSTGRLKQMSIAPSRGADPCHIAVDAKGKFVYVANYTGANVARFPVKVDGSLAESDKLVQHIAGAHAHAVTMAPDDKTLLVNDLGIDQIITYDLDLNRIGEVKESKGSGPRHLALTPSHKFAYAINELNSTITPYSYDGHTLTPLGSSVSTVPAGFTGNKSSAEIAVHPSGKFLYASNRGGDTIAMFPIGHDGTLGPAEQISSGGKTPRNFKIDPTGKWMLVANQDSDNIVIYEIDNKTGKLTATGRELKASMPVCVLFLH